MARLILVLIACLGALAPLSRAEPVDGGHALVELISERQQAVPGETVYLALHKTLDPDWHVYWRNAGDAGLPPQILWDEAPIEGKTELGDFVWPIPHTIEVVEGEIMDYGYDDAVTLPFAVTVPEDASGPIRFAGTADYLICKDVCIPETAAVAFTLQVGETQIADTEGGEKIAAAFEKAPVALDGAARVTSAGETLTLSVTADDPARLAGITGLRFFPYENEIIHAAPQRPARGEAGVQLAMTAEPREPVGEALQGVLVATYTDGSRQGFEIAATPGEPLPGTAGQPLAMAEGGSGIGLIGILGLAILGGLVLNLMPCVLPVLSIKALGMVHAAAHGEARELRSHGLLYTAGVLTAFAALAAVFVALRSAGDFVTVGFLLQYPGVVAGLALAAFVLGLWLLGVFELGSSLQNVGAGLAGREGPAGAYMTGLLAATAGAPCVGPFMGASLGAVISRPAVEVFAAYLALGFGLALPFLVLSFAPGLHRYLPRPGAWMERLKQFFAFPMFLTAAALLFVLGSQAGTGAVAWVTIGAVLIGFGIWALKVAGGRIRPAGLALGAVALVAGLVLPVQAAASGRPDAGTAEAAAEAYQAEVWSHEAVAAALADGKGVFVDFTATWCMICQANKRTTLNRAQVREAFSEAGIVFMVADFTRKDPEIAAELKRRGRPGVPMYLLFPPGDPQPRILPETLTPALVLKEIEAVTG